MSEMINCCICGESVPQEDFAEHVQGHAHHTFVCDSLTDPEAVKAIKAPEPSSAWIEAARLADRMGRMCTGARTQHQNLLRYVPTIITCAYCGKGIPIQEFYHHKYICLKQPCQADVIQQVESLPAPIDLNEVIPYRIEARREHERLMAAHRLRGELNEANLRIDVMQKLENLMEGFCGPRLDYTPPGEPPKPKEG